MLERDDAFLSKAEVRSKVKLSYAEMPGASAKEHSAEHRSGTFSQFPPSIPLELHPKLDGRADSQQR